MWVSGGGVGGGGGSGSTGSDSEQQERERDESCRNARLVFAATVIMDASSIAGITLAARATFFAGKGLIKAGITLGRQGLWNPEGRIKYVVGL